MQFIAPPSPHWETLMDSLNTALMYLLIAALNGWLLILWYHYNRRRARTRRHTAVLALRDDELASSFNVAPQIISEMSRYNLLTVYHDQIGQIIDLKATRYRRRRKRAMTHESKAAVGGWTGNTPGISRRLFDGGFQRGFVCQPREDGDAGFRGAGGRHHDHARRAAQTNLLRQIVNALQHRFDVGGLLRIEAGFLRLLLDIRRRQLAFVMAGSVNPVMVGQIGIRPFLLIDLQAGFAASSELSQRPPKIGHSLKAKRVCGCALITCSITGARRLQ